MEISPIQRKGIFDAIDAQPAWRGAGVLYVETLSEPRVLRPSLHDSGLTTYVVIEWRNASLAPSDPPPPPTPPTAWSRLWPELVGAGVNCGAMAYTYSGIAAEIGAAPLTAGLSLSAMPVTIVGAGISTVQCYNSLYRLQNVLFDPATNDALDSEAWYRTTSLLLDGLSVAGAVASLGGAAQALIRLQRASGRPFLDFLRAMDRPGRRRLAQDLARYAGTAPTRRQFIRMARAGQIPKIYRVDEVTRAVRAQIHYSISAALGLGSSLTSGVVGELIVGLAQED